MLLSWTHPIKKALKEPFESVYSRVDAVFVQMLFQLWKKLFQDPVVVSLEAQELWKTLDEKAWKKGGRERMRDVEKNVYILIRD